MFYGITLNNVAAAFSEVLFSTAAAPLCIQKDLALGGVQEELGGLVFNLRL